jgi:hypothetical protein
MLVARLAEHLEHERRARWLSLGMTVDLDPIPGAYMWLLLGHPVSDHVQRTAGGRTIRLPAEGRVPFSVTIGVTGSVRNNRAGLRLNHASHRGHRCGPRTKSRGL